MIKPGSFITITEEFYGIAPQLLEKNAIFVVVSAEQNGDVKIFHPDHTTYNLDVKRIIEIDFIDVEILERIVEIQAKEWRKRNGMSL